MPQLQNQVRPKPRLKLIWIVFLPVILLFDIGYYWTTRSSCLQCGNVSEFVRQSSLSFFLIGEAYRLLRKR